MKNRVFRWRGFILAPVALAALLFGRPTFLSFGIGIVIALLGEAIRIWGVGYSGKTTRKGELEAPELACAGPYAYTRNPLYIGNFITAAGFLVIAAGNMELYPMIFLAAFFLAAYIGVYWIIIGLEEEFLRKEFKEEYENYCKYVPRIFPRLKPYPGRKGKFSPDVIFQAEIHTIIIFIIVALLFFLKIPQVWEWVSNILKG
ncbi:MAG: isoprenylcysteine carboxylmethyltransferase family protein [Chloroflexi bacterium]|nr:isoprenylcysteine carboxylmethyltransferase family protein [Chloroflexota bacterium]